MDNELEVIHHQMEETRASLADKLDSLENHVLGTVHEATDAVSHTVEDVKSVVGSVTDSVKETVDTVTESVKHTFDMRDHVHRHPWGMFCGAVAIGFVGGRLLAPSQSAAEETSRALPPSPPPPPAPQQAQREESQTGMNEILERVKGLALGALMGMVRDFLAESLPESMKADVMGVVDDFTTKLGGKPQPPAEATETNGEPPAPATGGQTHEDRTQTRSDGPKAGEKERSQAGKKNQPSGGRFDRRNQPPRR